MMLKLEGINKAFNKDTVDETVLFRDFDFSVEKGEFISVVGSNGSGKTTMLNLICGSDTADSGKIIFEDHDITALSEHKRASFIGRVFQNPTVGTCSGLTILENMALADNKNRLFGLSFAVNRKREDHYRELLEQCDMGLENRLNVKVGSLSGGQRQALALVIANMTKIKLLILDEHTAALDPKSSEIMMKLTDRIVKGNDITTIMVTHNLRYAVEYGNRLIMMHEGEIIKDLKDEKKKQVDVDDLLDEFYSISIENGNGV